MKEGWEVKSLGDIAEVEYGFTSQSFTEGDYRYIRITDISENGELISSDQKYLSHSKEAENYLLKNNDLLMARTGATFAKVLLYNDIEPSVFASYLIRIIFKEKIDNKLYWYFTKTKSYWDQANKLASGAAQPHFNGAAVKQVTFSYPKSPSEQRRIVSILDKAFAAIEKAKANAEQNLKNARELFESYLQGVFEEKGEGWVDKYFEDCFKLKSGDGLTSKSMVEGGKYPVFGGNGIAGYHNSFNLSGSNVIIGRVGALCGNVRHVKDEIWLTDNAFKIVDFKFDFDYSFLTYLLNFKNLRSFARQAAQPVISNASLKDVVLHFPTSRKTQKDIVQNLDKLFAQTKSLESIYQTKLKDLEELKKSILQKAFSGEL